MIEQGGEKLVIDCKTDLLKLFDEPCRGVRKTIKISYVARCGTKARYGERMPYASEVDLAVQLQERRSLLACKTMQNGVTIVCVEEISEMR